ncbi:3-deoxy-D-manno-octulosonic acid transferase [Lutibaculum baratangense]|uniref:3-deoxy-D-manno-octulosonic acid transferase n=1 Tax=Lutibaculum baratangense AMV1 TaxID=631454 RepID=V4RFN4_9HYPH|nr:3-deoxy-D-manno-octulosonic acid transferase [Lutibaculum baratangense]ESR24956.1 3-deoxy-D-manno-octulosonic-acid transferase [Lutibaculum baratangense AMV1]
MTSPRSSLLRAYRIATRLGTPLAGSFVKWRARKGKEDMARRGERFGIPSEPRPQGPLLWVHAASVGETMAVLPLIARILAHWPVHVLLTTTTVTSARLAGERLPQGAFHQFSPLDSPRFVERFLDHWRPGAAIFVESEIWPNIISSAHKRHVPLVLVNARLSERSFERWRQRPRAAADLFPAFDLCLAKSEQDARRYRELGTSSAASVGNLKFDAPVLPARPTDLAAFQYALNRRPVWTACSTHPGEEELILDAHREIAGRHRDLLTIIAPRHPERRQAVLDLAAERDLTVQLRTQAGRVAPETEIYLLDTIGELGLAMRLAPVVFMGGSLVPHQGQNPIEPAKLGRLVLHGPHVMNFAEVYEALDAVGGAEIVNGSRDLARLVDRFLSSPSSATRRGEAAKEAIIPFEGAIARTLNAVSPILERMTTEG